MTYANSEELLGNTWTPVWIDIFAFLLAVQVTCAVYVLLRGHFAEILKTESEGGTDHIKWD